MRLRRVTRPIPKRRPKVVLVILWSRIQKVSNSDMSCGPEVALGSSHWSPRTRVHHGSWMGVSTVWLPRAGLIVREHSKPQQTILVVLTWFDFEPCSERDSDWDRNPEDPESLLRSMASLYAYHVNINQIHSLGTRRDSRGI